VSQAMEGLLAPSELFQRHCSRPVKIIIRVRRYTILPLAEGYANFKYVALFIICEIILKKNSLLVD